MVLWDAQTGEKLRHIGGTGMAHSVAFSPDGQSLATGSMESMVKLWRIAGGDDPDFTLQGGTDNPSSVAFSPDGMMLATSGCVVRRASS